MPAGEDLYHVEAIKRKLKMRCRSLHRQTLAAAGNSHNEDTFGDNLSAQFVAHLEQLLPFSKPFLEAFLSADFTQAGTFRDELDVPAAADQQFLLLQQRR